MRLFCSLLISSILNSGIGVSLYQCLNVLLTKDCGPSKVNSFNISKLSPSFLEWFCGVTDGEGTFYIRKRTSSVFSFKFVIGMHIDDIAMLNFIQKTLGFGKVSINANAAYFEVYDLKNIPKIIEIFTLYPLNTTKYLNFLDFKKAYELYKSSKSYEVKQEVGRLKDGMNTQRINFKMPESHRIKITPNWLLGFVEGEGSFFVSKGFNLTFNLVQASIDSDLMYAIRDFFDNLPGTAEFKRDGNDSVVYIGVFKGSSGKEITRICIRQTSYIRSVLIPFFENLEWRSKKSLDFKDWVNILKLKDRCHQYEDKGKKLMDTIINQMNSKRLSTSGVKLIPGDSLLKKVNDLLNGPSNCEIRDGKVWIISLNRFRPVGGLIKPMKIQLQDLNGNIVKTFATQTECGKYLNTTRTTIARWLEEGRPVLFEKQLVYISKGLEEEEE